MARVLSVVERCVQPEARHDYLGALPSRRAAASAVHAHFWVFQHGGDEGRFMEFIEAASASAILSAGGFDSSSNLWHEVQGA